MTSRTNGAVSAPLDTLLTATQAARELAVCRRTIQNLVYRGELLPVHIGARAIRFRSSDIARIQDVGVMR